MKLTIDKLNKSYGQNHALIDFTCTFTPGIYGLLGPNGAGKSTMMNIMAGNLKEDSGTIDVEPRVEVLSTPGYMPQQQTLYEDFSARSFLHYMAGLKKIQHPKDGIEYLLEIVNLKSVAHKRIGSFSGGMKQRILLAQALLGNPNILLLDEPTAGLDPMERIRIRNFISRFAKDKIILIATHVVSDIEFIAGQIIMLQDGKTVGIHSPGEWLDSIHGKVWECTVAEDEIADYQSKYKISNISRQSGGITLRIISDEPLRNAQMIKPMLEDVYLYTHGTIEVYHEI